MLGFTSFLGFKFFLCFLFVVFLFFFPYCSFFFPLLPFSFSFLLLLFPDLHHHFMLRASTLSCCFAHALFLPTYPIHHSTLHIALPTHSVFYFSLCLLTTISIYYVLHACHILPSHHVLIFLLSTLTCLTIKLLFA